MIRCLVDKSRLTKAFTTVAKLTTSPARQFATALKKSEAAESIAKDVIVYQYENPRLFKVLNIFSISQVFFWGYVGNWVFVGMRDVKPENVNEDTPWYRKINLGEAKYKNTIAGGCFVLGWFIITLAWLFTLRSVRYLIMRKGGQKVAVVCYTPFGQNRIMDVPIKCISAQESRSSAGTFLPLKIQNTRLFYILDMKGQFKNTRLFDSVIGLKRNFK